MDRRRFITVLGGGALLAAGGCAPSGADPAGAWGQAGAQSDPRLHALSYAVLAPNPHNRQPWLARLDGADEITLFVDRARLLPATDPFSRQIMIGCGAFLELLALAASQNGRRAEITPWPEGEPNQSLDARPFAHVRLVASDAAPEPLFAQIAARRSNKTVYDRARTPSAEILAKVAASGVAPGLRTAFTNAPPEVARFRSLTDRAHVREIETPVALQESIDLMRIGGRQIAAHRDGIALDGPAIEVMRATGVLTPEKLATPGTMAFKQGLTFVRPMVESTNAFMWLISNDNDRGTQLATGRAYARLNLTATREGLAMHPMSQSLQEFPEMAELKGEADRLTRVGAGERLQMLVRVGYAKPSPPAPRRGLKEHLIA